MLVRCLYASRAAVPLSKDILDAIMARSSTNNPALGITGLLCYTADVFVQVIEGGRDEVCELYNAIIKDERHLDVRLLVYEEIAERKFGGWTMGRVNLDNVNRSLVLKYSEKPELNPFTCSGATTMALLQDLAKTGTIGS
jgi:hypothetical protein